MKKGLAIIFGWLMILCLAGTSAAAGSVSREEFYQAGLSCLKDLTAESVQEAAASFDAAGNYAQAQYYWQYALLLADILSISEGETDLNSTVRRLQKIEQSGEFTNSLAENGLPSCQALLQYIQARQHEMSGEYIQALNIYNAIPDILDSLRRQLDLYETVYQQAEELYRNRDYRKAAELFQNLDYADSAERYRQILSDHEHQWREATCTEPKTCAVFGETEGKPLGHDWAEATCTEPKTCRRCGITEGKPLGHDWTVGSCTELGKCSRCGLTDGEALGHEWQNATCTEPRTCKRCGATEGDALGHDWREATCTEPATCSRCGAVSGEPLGHDWEKVSGSVMKKCRRCGKTETDVAKGDIIVFGSYEQDNNKNNGREPIEWMILDIQDGKALLLSKYGLEAKPYNTRDKENTWEKCTLRAWLNSEFLNNAFTKKEQSAILLTEVDNSPSQGYWSVPGGNNTQDRIFTLSYAEANRYLGVKTSVSNTKARVAPTKYAINAGAKTFDDYKTADGMPAVWWWLRSPGDNQHSAAYVGSGGSLDCYVVIFVYGVVRPALWVNLESDIF